MISIVLACIAGALIIAMFLVDNRNWGSCLVALAAACMLFLSVYAMNGSDRETLDYYLPAEIVAENEISTYFGCENGHIY